ncbi:MAG: ATP-binding protein [Nitrospirae bacterium]|nr:ATP-binding protein [Nitrospirota bacterium]
MLGARQTGKTTLLQQLKPDILYSLVQPNVRQRYEKDPSLLAKEIEAGLPQNRRMPVIAIDEVQKVPEIMDVLQDLIDRKIAQFILTGSSARKLKKGNLLPGRVVVSRLDPVMLAELPAQFLSLDELLIFGSLPGILAVKQKNDKEIDLQSYVTTYLEEEIRAEALVRQIGTFSRFLELAASESGNIINLSKISQQLGIVHTTVAGYYRILEDCLVAERIDPITTSRHRQKLTKSPKYLFFDLGIRRVSAGEGQKLPAEIMGNLFEQFIGLELVRCSRLTGAKVHFWRDPDGPEVDWVIESEGKYIPIEVKYKEAPTVRDSRHLKVFLSEYKNADIGYVVCRTPRRFKIDEQVTAVPWMELDRLVIGPNNSSEHRGHRVCKL